MAQKDFIVEGGLKVYNQSKELILEASSNQITTYKEFITVGSGTTIDTQNVILEDNVLTINSNQTGIPLSNLKSGIEVERGDENNYFFFFAEEDDSFKIGESTSLQSVATREDNPTVNGIPFWNNTERRYDTNSNLVFDGDLKFNNLKVATESWVSTNYQELLISGTNIKTVNNESLLGTGNIEIDAEIDWADITNKPTTFTPSSHTHLWADITDKPTTFTPSSHTHLWADITDKPTTFTPSSHSHDFSDLSGTDLTIGGKLIHQDDTDTYLSFTTNTMAFTTGGTERMRIDGSGDVSIVEDLSVEGNMTLTGSLNGAPISSYFRAVSTSSGTAGAGWMTVAYSSTGRQHARVFVSDADAGDHAFIQIDWLRSYQDSNFTVINTGGHGNRITGARVLQQTADITYGPKYLQVWVTVSSNYYVGVHDIGYVGGYGNPSAVTPVVENKVWVLSSW